MNLSHCTLTGVDESTDLSRLADLSTEFPFVEWGFLYSPTRQGQPGRYPSVATLLRAFRELPSHVRVALHICGRGVQDLLDEEPVVHELVKAMAGRQRRIQLNFNQRRNQLHLEGLRKWMDKHDGITVITQHNEANAAVHEAFREQGNHAILFDASGGQGISPEAWPEPLLGTPCGYAGGLGPGKIWRELDRIDRKAPTQVVWIDMEGKLRTPDPAGVADWFDLSRCEDCLREVSSWAAANIRTIPVRAL